MTVEVPPQECVLAVVVLYQRDLEGTEPWSGLSNLMQDSAQTTNLRLIQVLIYDNSPQSMKFMAPLPDWATYVHCPENGGTAAAYRHAAELARQLCAEWLLLLDQDSRLPSDLLAVASQALDSLHSNSTAALLPRVRHGIHLISPARINWCGSVLPIAAATSKYKIITGIASGALLRVEDFLNLGPLPKTLWLDFVDHYIFLRLQQTGKKIKVIDIELQHDLSVRTPALVSDQRLQSILDGEAVFYKMLALPARSFLPLRRLVRGLRLLRSSPRSARKILGRLWST